MPSPDFIGPPTKPSSVQIMPEEFRDQTAFDIAASGGKRYMIPAESGAGSSIHESLFMAELTSVQVRNGGPSELPHVGQVYKSVDKLERFYNSLGRDLTVDEEATLNRSRVYRDEKIMGLQSLAQNTIAARARELGQNLDIKSVDKIPPQLNLLEAIPNLKESLLATGMPVDVINSQILAPALNYTLNGLDITKGGVSGQKYLIKMDDNNVGEVTKLVPVDPSVSEQDVAEIKSDVAAEGATPKQANDTAIAVVEAADAMAKNSELAIRPAEALEDAKFIRGQVGATGKPIEVAVDTATNSLIIRNNPMIETKGVSAALNGYFNDNLKDPRGLMTMRNLIAEQAKNDVGNIPEIAEMGVPAQGGLRLNTMLANTKPAAYDPAENAKKLKTVGQGLFIIDEMMGAIENQEGEPLFIGAVGSFVTFLQGAGEQLNALGLFLENDKDREVYTYMQNAAEGAFKFQDGKIVDIANKARYFEYLRIQLAYMLARALENPEGGGARLSVADVENMERALGGKGFSPSVSQLRTVLTSIQGQHRDQRAVLEMYGTAKDPFEWAATTYIRSNSAYNGFRRGMGDEAKFSIAQALLRKNGYDPGPEDIDKLPEGDPDFNDDFMTIPGQGQGQEAS